MYRIADLFHGSVTWKIMPVIYAWDLGMSSFCEMEKNLLTICENINCEINTSFHTIRSLVMPSLADANIP